ncbi:hypothetical protein COW53_06370 [bacterium CG17_big_fil_post_rev_8_21_14_2_50_64_8]|nr:MAG: hypothetical protein COW53_06370 [bacterium CG17_big_fil_post_rev_8_21_14_2_50_64_8]
MVFLLDGAFMDIAMNSPVHTFHIPVMGTGFTIDTPLKVAHYGISSAISLVDDRFIEQMRSRICRDHGEPYEPIADKDEDARARRITAYLDLLDTLVHRNVERVRNSVFAKGSEIARYFELLPPSPLRRLYESMEAKLDGPERLQLQENLRQFVQPGGIDVNIMTKLDNDRDRSGHKLPDRCSDALSALRGFMNSRVEGSLVLSAGMNRRLFSYMGEFKDLTADKGAGLRKRIVLKVSDYRSALVQGKLLARLGLPVAEFRVESGLNCGGHAFGGAGKLLGPVLEEFKQEKAQLAETLRNVRSQTLKALGCGDSCDDDTLVPRITVQGGLGDPDEERLLREVYGVDGTGWGSAFLFVPEAVNIDPASLQQLIDAGEQDIRLSGASPLGVPFWNLTTSASEQKRLQRISSDQPGSPCPKGYLVSSSEFTTMPLCTASRAFQRRKLEQIDLSQLSSVDKRRAQEDVVAKACICHDLSGCATVPLEIDPGATPAICCGPNAAYFQQAVTLKEMIDHIYGRARIALHGNRPHMFLKELSLHIEQLRKDLSEHAEAPSEMMKKAVTETRENLQQGIAHYRELAARLGRDNSRSFLAGLDQLQGELMELGLKSKVRG